MSEPNSWIGDHFGSLQPLSPQQCPDQYCYAPFHLHMGFSVANCWYTHVAGSVSFHIGIRRKNVCESKRNLNNKWPVDGDVFNRNRSLTSSICACCQLPNVGTFERFATASEISLAWYCSSLSFYIMFLAISSTHTHAPLDAMTFSSAISLHCRRSGTRAKLIVPNLNDNGTSTHVHR